MYPERKIQIEDNKVEEFYWNGKMVVYVNNHAVSDSFDMAVEKIKKAGDLSLLNFESLR